jgi:hypothetical protein
MLGFDAIAAGPLGSVGLAAPGAAPPVLWTPVAPPTGSWAALPGAAGAWTVIIPPASS